MEYQNILWQPLFMDPIYKETVWGGTQIADSFHKPIPSQHTGESWEVAAHANGKSVIRNGFLAGLDLQEALDKAGREILGSTVYQRTGNHFPLLIKLIDANDNLSVQVHPDDQAAARLEGPGECGKTEMWHVLEAVPGARLIYGFNQNLTKEQFAEAIERQTLDQLVNWIPVKKGDTFFIPAGTLHAIGAGILIAEIQQNSDTTYRVYDFGRLGLDGKPRELHTEKALQVTDLSSSIGNELSDIDQGVSCSYFTTIRRQLDGQGQIQPQREHFQILMILEGSGEINGLSFKKGDTILLPAALDRIDLHGQATYLQIF